MPTLLADLTTLRVGGPADQVATATTPAELVDAVRTADAADRPVLLVGGGSNLVVGDGGWPGIVVLVRTDGVDRREDGDRVALTVQAGVGWDVLVAHTVSDGLSGLETMSGIPGLVGATPVQNVGAYGTEVNEVITRGGSASNLVRRRPPPGCGMRCWSCAAARACCSIPPITTPGVSARSSSIHSSPSSKCRPAARAGA